MSEPIRGDLGWRINMARTGEWDAPPPAWALPDTKAQSPFSQKELADALSTLREIYPRNRVRDIFRREPDSTWTLFVDPWASAFSLLVALGLDAHLCGASKSKSLVDALSGTREQFDGARLEIAVFAALERVGIPHRHEPLRHLIKKALAKRLTPRNPDFFLDLDVGFPVFLEVKSASRGDRQEEESAWLLRFSLDMPLSGRIPAKIEMLPLYAELQERDGGAWMRANISRLVATVDEVKVWLSNTGPYPAVAVVEDCIRVEVTGPPGATTASGVLGVVLNSEREARRIVQQHLAKGVTQLPPRCAGLVLVDPGAGVDVDALRAEIERWFTAEGAAYRNLFGVLVLSRQYFNNFSYQVTRVEPVWRATAPKALRDSQAWDALTIGLSWHELRRHGVWDQLTHEAQ